MAQCSEDELYQRADNLLRHATQHFQSLFLQRWELHTQSKWNGKDSVQQLIEMLDLQLSRILLPHQKDQLVQGVVEEWDITLLSRLLIHFNDEQDDEADQAIRSITDVRNKLAHNARKKLSLGEYSSIESEVRKNLIILGMKEKVIQNVINQAEATSMNSALEQLRKRQAEGDDLFNKKSYKKAIEAYSDAMLLPNLPHGHLSVLYEKRGYCHMYISKTIINFKLKNAQWDLAFSDGEKAIKLNVDSWKGNHILALVYQDRGKLNEAQVHFRRAIAISPGEPEVKSDMDACTIMEGKLAREDHLDTLQMPMSLSESVKQYNDDTNSNISEDAFLENFKAGRKQCPGQDHFATGYQYLAGWRVPQSYSEAAKYFAKARQAGNAQGIYNLAVLYKDGMGVKSDISFAVELFLEAANKPVETDKSCTNPKDVDIGILAAQHSLGLLYEEGVGVPKDFVKAAFWYKKAADRGYGGSANNLALLHHKGLGFPVNEKIAETYWKMGVRDKNMQSAYALYIYYFQNMEPQLARSYFNMAIEMGLERLKTFKAQAFKMIDKMEKERAELEDDIKAFEKASKLSKRGLTFYERMKREASSRSPEMAKLVEDLDRLKVGEDGITTPQIWGERKEVDVHELVWKADEGSKTAQSMLNCMINNARFIEIWSQRPPRDQVELEGLISSLYLCLCTDAHLLKLPLEMYSALPEFLNKLFQKFGGEKSKLDMELRLCLFHFQSGVGGVDELHTELLAEALRRYPDEIPLYKALAVAYVNLKDFRKGLEVSINGLLKAPNDPDLLHDKAAHLRLLDTDVKDGEKVREAYNQFIKYAPADHRMLPEAFYCIAYSYLVERKTMSETEVNEQILHYYGLGEEAEKAQLSCYLPCESNVKVVLKNFKMGLENEKNSIKGLTKKSTEVSRMLPSGNTSRPEEKMYLKDPRRIGIIKRHREMAERMKKMPENEYKISASVEPKLVHKIKSFNELKSIGLQEMNPTKDQIYEGRFLNLTVIEGPFFGLTSIPLIVEDETGEAITLCIYNIKQNEKAKRTFGVGAKFSVINPYMRIGIDGTNAIRVDDPNCLIHNEGVKDMCRYCGKEGAKSSCSRCNKANYCGKLCQEIDWKVLKHKLICERV